ncbi:uncharacterized protein LOC121693391 [Alosa sapidissima]|uniref:uncharacterized protein LOC121693391 n=1 Tax=Alosa sapidissima TaxID=34773 RepID=UPI001C08C2BE|nr:uncharacterized protein LOC121693391 [Alosa sapidissima]XP_041928719.1 uncharacterized protein LOC121693391 [Alosa sapidissima]XP_041928720.1 uncharacterized protein LOC121693391 [Alosa sapidissima]XP_041928721.1 uncharacterized protein LOC121693391 [Alosa sapidissima]
MSTWRRRSKYNCKANREDKHVHRGPDRVDILTFKYKEMCKMDSSSDSESDASPRWSDTSSKGNVSSAAERKAAQKLPSMTHKPTGWHNVCIDPYDGSSEDSCTSTNDSRRPKKGSCRFWVKFRRGSAMHGPLPKEVKRSGPADGAGDIHMLSDPEIDITNQKGHWPSSDVNGSEAKVLEDSGVFTKSLSDSPSPVLLTDGGDCVQSLHGPSNENSQETGTQPPDYISGHDSLFKRKLFPAQGEMGYWNRKRQCVTKMGRESNSP